MADSTIRPQSLEQQDADKTIRPQSLEQQDADKTIRPQSLEQQDADKTVRPQSLEQQDADKTVRPQSIGQQDADKTVRPANLGSEAVDKTVRPQTPLGGGNDKTVRQTAQEIARLNSENEKEYTIDGKRYKFVRFLSQGTGEGDILLVEHGGKQFVLKLYYPGLTLPDEKVLKEVKSSDGKIGLVGLYSFGTWQNPHSEEKRCYELMQYCEGGSLAEYELKGNEEQFKKLAVMMAMCINACHQHGFLHCDIKPANFMFVDKNKTKLALCDFGISIPCDKDGVAKNTSDARTRIYAAPEFYFHVPGADGREIYRSSDFYSLGMSLLCLWMGESVFKQKESELMHLKVSGKLPYPPELSDHTLCLLKALTTVDSQSRCNFKQIVEWAKGSNPFEQYSEKKKEIKSSFNVVFNASKEEVAHSPEELAEFMFKEPELAEKYLYSGKIGKWLKDNLRPELEIEMEEIVESKYLHDKRAGLYAACYVLDPAMPYYDVRGNACTTEAEIALSIAQNRQAYENALTNSGDLLYVFLRSQGLAQIADKVLADMNRPKATAEDKREAINQLIFTIDPAQPFRFEAIGKDKKITLIECYTFKQLIDAVHDNAVSSSTWNDLAKPSFLLWVGHRDKAVQARIMSMMFGFSTKNAEYSYGVLYGLHRNVNYMLEWDQNQYYTYQHIGQYINQMVDADINPTKYNEYERKTLGRQYGFMRNFKGSRLYFYLKSKGSYDQWIKWIEACYNVTSKDNQNKAAPYNLQVASYKCVKGMGVDPIYTTLGGKQLRTLRDVKSLSKKEIKAECGSQRALQDWLTVFFQEDPALDLKKKYTFEKKTVDYVEYLESIGVDTDEVKRYKQASKGVRGSMSKIKRKYGGVVTMRVLLGLFCFVPLLAIIAVLCVVGFPFDGNPLEGHFWGFVWICAFLLFIPMCILDELAGKVIGEFIVSGILGVILYWVFILLLEVLVPLAPYIVALLLLLFGVLILVKCYIKMPLQRSLMKQLTSNDSFEEMYLEPLHYAFRTNGSEPFYSSIADSVEQYAAHLSVSLKKLMWYAFPTMIVTAALFYLMIVLTPRIVAKNTSINSRTSYMVGTWTGTFDGKNSAIDIHEATVDKVVGYVHVKFQKVSNEKVVGSISTRKNTMVLKDEVKNGVLDGTYTCKFKDNTFSQMSGTYRNPSTGKTIPFEYSRTRTKEEIDAGIIDDNISAWEVWLRIFKQKFGIEKKAA